MSMKQGMSADQIAQRIDHTYLKPDATTAVIQKLCQEAVQFGFYSVCVNGMWVSRCREWLAGTDVKVAAVVGFPLGAMSVEALSAETAAAVRDGASEIDMVLPIGALLEGDYDTVKRHIEAVVQAAGKQTIVKVIMETGFLNDEQKRTACRLSEEAGAGYVKTSTGFGPGGATEADIRLMRDAVSSHIGVKASGGVRDFDSALRMIEAGATRIGTSSGPAIVQGLTATDSY